MTRILETKGRVLVGYEYVPPEGGWGYVVTLAVALTFIVTVAPLAAFGLVFGGFMATLGDETGGTTLVNGVFNTVLSFTGLAANQLLQKSSYRKVGLLGAFLYFLGSFGTIFVTNLTQMLITFGVLQGMGFGLMMPACFTAFNLYFVKKQNVMMGVSQVIIVAVTMGWPIFTETLMENYGWRGAAAILSALSLNCFVAMLTLQPVKWHMKKIKVSMVDKVKLRKTPKEHVGGLHVEEPLLNELRASENALKSKTVSISSLNGYAASLQDINRCNENPGDDTFTIWQRMVRSLDLGLFKDPVYVNIAFGLSLGITSDLAFISIMPLMLIGYGFDGSQITLIMTVYFASDLVSRILLSVLSGVMKVWNRYVFLIGALFSAIFRIAFVLNGSFWWVTTASAALGFLRCFIQTPLPLVVAEQYGARFTTAFSLYMVVCGFVALTVGLLSGLVKNLTQSNVMVVHLLTVVYLLCAVPWLIEIVAKKLFARKT